MSPEAGATILLGILALLILFTAVKRGSLKLPEEEWVVPIRLFHVLGAFAIYFLITLVISSVAIALLKKQIMIHFMAFSNWLNFSVSFLVFLSLFLYTKNLSSSLRMGLIQRPSQPYSLFKDIGAAFSIWIIAFPLVLFFNQILELIIAQAFHLPQLPDQIAVKFLKSTFESPFYFTLATLSIIVLAPLIEETLFRGFLQSYIRQHLGPRQAICITSVCFSLFHYSAGQGLGNVSIILSLFLLSLFLGFLYEKRGSLRSPMILHGLFNAVSVVNLYLFGGLTTGI
jgi:membrane protease YdiL (CAAX protease family)